MSIPDAPAQRETPAEWVSTEVDGIDVLGALSPSRASDFLSCPLLFRFRTIDRLPEPPSVDAMRGTVVHQVLEDLFDVPAPERTPERAEAMVQGVWEQVLVEQPEAALMFDGAGGSGPDVVEWLLSCRASVRRYFDLEDPRRIEPAEREVYVEALLESKLLLRGFIDRLDVNAAGDIRINDYKGLACDTPLPTPAGWTTMGDVAVGDLLLGADGRPTRVTSKSNLHDRPCFEVTFRDGSTVVSDNVHLWAVVTSRRQVRTTQTLDTEQLMRLQQELAAEGRPHSLWIDAAAPLRLRTTDLPIDPWLLGAWLGDGDDRGGSLTVGKHDLSDMVSLVKEHWTGSIGIAEEASSFHISISRLQETCAYGHDDWTEASGPRPRRRCAQEHRHVGAAKSNQGLTAHLRDHGLIHNKHIPEPYLRASGAQRVALLRGLMDTDGWWNKTRERAGFTTTNDRLADDVVHLLRTLGISCQHFSKPYVNAVRAPRTCHIIEFTPQDFNPFALPRKALLCGTVNPRVTGSLAQRRIITSVEPHVSVPTQCVAVDSPDSMYLCSDAFIPTHNTGRSPREGFETRALFQLKFYALALWRTRGVVPRVLRLVYLGNGELITYEPDEDDLLATERKVEAVWRAIKVAEETGDYQPHRSALCGWCAHQALCPAWGGTPPPLPDKPQPAVVPAVVVESDSPDSSG